VESATVRQLVGVLSVGAVAVVAAVVTSPAALFARAELLAARPGLLAVALLALYLVRPLLAWPISALSVLLGYLYGPAVIPVALAGAVVTTLPPYALARSLEHDAGLFARVGDAGAVVRRTAGDLRGTMAARLAPLPTDPVSYTAGLAGVPLRPYLVGTAAGEAPWVATAVLLGASMGQLTSVGLSADPLLLVTTAALAALLVVSGPAYRRLRNRAIQ
jgi:uncharacterized membrane protein YdjX (TVP38/TMEM64 family)